jgi:CheY-like chemotaxis protein
LENNKKILVVDDEGPIRRVIVLKLKNRGYEVLSAANGEEGLRLIETERPDAVITDIMMPRMDGQELCQRTNKLKEEHPFLTIVMTCRISPEEQEWVNRLQETILIKKPFSANHLLKEIENYFGGQAC